VPLFCSPRCIASTSVSDFGIACADDRRHARSSGQKTATPAQEIELDGILAELDPGSLIPHALGTRTYWPDWDRA
jgi:hypothetical protein